MPSASRVNWAKLRVTALVVAAVAILSVFLYLLTGGTVLESKATLYLYMPDATAVGSGAPVRVNGIDVGKVSSVSFSGDNNPNRVIRLVLSVQVEHLSDIPADSYAQISAETAVGDKYVDVTRGRSTDHLQPDGEIPFKAQPELLKTLDLQQFEQQLRDVDATLADIEQGRSRVGQFVQGEGMFNDIRRRLVELDRAFRQAVATTSSVGSLLQSTELYDKISAPLVQMDNTLSRLQSTRFLRDEKQYSDLHDRASALRKSIADIRAQPLMSSDELYMSWIRTLTSFIQRVDEMNQSPSFSSSETYDNLNGLARQLQESLREFRRDPEKYMRIKMF
jgi:phospholipid/cholesterol/gamma-HCH transport system substrate-binding protein